ncbi:hypothetical protein BLSTO_05583, partial [Blastocystis sp. subtype 1]
MEALAKTFRSIGLDAKMVSALLKSGKKATLVADAIREAGVTGGCDRTKGNLIYNVATTLPESSKQYRPLVLRWIVDGEIKSNYQVSEAISYLKKLPSNDSFNESSFKAACGVGVIVSDKEIADAVKGVVNAHRDELIEQRYAYPISRLMYSLRDGNMKWADGRKVKSALDAAILALLGEKTEADESNRKRPKKKEKEQPLEGFANARYLATSKNSPELIAQHLKATGGKIRCRFPPEPNGYLHIGHAKSMYLNFKGAFERVGKEGETVLRFDDTNPEAEKLEFIDNIKEDVAWLGWKPCQVNF